MPVKGGIWNINEKLKWLNDILNKILLIGKMSFFFKINIIYLIWSKKVITN
jgi:hypothetical protein